MKKPTVTVEEIVRPVVYGAACGVVAYLCYRLGWACSQNGFGAALSECCANRKPGYIDYNGHRLLVTV